LALRNTLSALGEILDALSIRWTLIGALAANRYRTTPRLTNDVDVLLADAGEGLESLEAGVDFDVEYVERWAQFWDVSERWEQLRKR
jgi:hypothetical protein